MGMRRVKLVIDSDLINVPLVGMAMNRLCSLIPLSEVDSLNIELCVVEAVTNSIKHSFSGRAGHEVEVVFTLSADELTIDIYDTGLALDTGLLERADIAAIEHDISDIENIAEKGRGLPIIKEIMDRVSYKSEGGKNCLTLKKKLPSRSNN